MDVKSVALQLRKLASDPDNQVYIVNEKGCMKGLMGFLDNGDSEVVCISLQALQFLSSHPLNKEPLSKQEGLLGKLVNFTDSEDENIKKLADSTLANLQEFINGEDPNKKKEKAAPARFTPSYLYNVPLQIKERVVPLQMNLIERALIGVKGVVSVTINKNEVIVYTRAQDQDIVQLLVAAVKSVGFTAVPGQGQDGSENKAASSTEGPSTASTTPLVVKPSIFTAVPSAASKENSGRFGNNTPSYPSVGPSYLAPRRTSDSKTALTEYTGYGQSTIDARLKKQRNSVVEEQEKKGAVRSIFGAVTSYFW